jgi:hypothetical protein
MVRANVEGANEIGRGIADYIENFYKTERRHSALNYLTPIEFEDLRSTHIHLAANVPRADESGSHEGCSWLSYFGTFGTAPPAWCGARID